MNKILIFQFRTDQSLEHERQCFQDVFRDIVRIDYINLLSQETPQIPDIRKYNGVIIAGSGQFNVTDWSDSVKERAGMIFPAIKKCVDDDFPLLGICFGHQLMAVCLGGTVERDPAQQEGGTVCINLKNEAFDDPLSKKVPRDFYVVAGHKDSVTRLPKNAKLLASSESTDVEIYKIKNNIYAVQFHPELDLEKLLYRFSLYPEYTNGRDISEIRKDYKDTPYAKTILKNFLSLTNGVR